MSYLALYRQWRPNTFADLLGQEHVSKTLKNALNNQKIRHAYLFCGPRGTGKTSTAKVLSKALNCLEPREGEPCNDCAACKRISRGSSLDVLEIDAASNRGIDEIRELRENVKFSPAEEKYKVYIIDEVHMLTQEAFNALLKTLEEPPERVIFILATTEPHKIPLTIISRCQRFDFRRIPDQIIIGRLKQILDTADTAYQLEAIQLIARIAEGGLRDALSLLDQCLTYGEDKLTVEQVTNVVGTVTDEVLSELVSMLGRRDMGGVLKLIDRMIADGKEIVRCTGDLMQYCRNLLLVKSGAPHTLFHLSEAGIAELERQAQLFSETVLWDLVETLKNAVQEMRWSLQPRISLELALIKFASQNIDRDHEHAENQKEAAKTQKETKEVSKKDNPENEKFEQVQSAPAKESFSVPEGKLTLEDIQHKWPEVLERVKKLKVTTFAFLVQGEPFALDGKELKLNFDSEYQFHKEKIAEPENIKIVEKVIEQILGQHLKVNSFLTDYSNSETGEDNNYEESDIVEKAIEIFGGDIVEVKEE